MKLPVYQPIDCSYHDILLAKATLKEVCTIVYASKEGEVAVKAQILDVYTKQKEEFMKLSSGETIRLDQIIRVNDDEMPEASRCKI